jgi:hypothetical protein
MRLIFAVCIGKYYHSAAPIEWAIPTHNVTSGIVLPTRAACGTVSLLPPNALVPQETA